MEDSMKQLVSPEAAWVDFLKNELTPTCAKHGWVVTFESATDGYCAIFTDTALLDEIPILTWEEFVMSEIGLDSE